MTREREATLAARPRPGITAEAARGDITLAGTRVLVPHGDRPAGVLVILHGAGGTAEGGLALVRDVAEGANVIVIAPKSAGPSWDVVDGGFGPDVAAIDRALAAVFAAYAIDPARVAIGGFSDGASYALTLGLANGDLFRTVLAFSPGFQLAPRTQGAPRIFVSHGTGDRVLAVAHSRRDIVPLLQGRGLEVDYHEFDGGHTVPAEMVRRAFAFLARIG